MRSSLSGQLLELTASSLTLRSEIAAWRFHLALKRMIELERRAGFDPNQPRIPAGDSEGGRWTDGVGAELTKPLNSRPLLGGLRTGRVAQNQDAHSSVTVHNARTITLSHDDGSAEIRYNGSRSWRNYNPGNLRVGDFATRHGAIGEAGGFAVFPDEETGRTAAEALLRSPSYSELTVDEAISRRSPSNENETERLQGIIRGMGSFSGTEIIKDLTDEEMRRLMEAIKRTEGWNEGDVVWRI